MSVASLFFACLLLVPHVGRVGEVCLASAQAVAAEAGRAPVYSSHAEDLAVMATWAYHESRLDPSAHGAWRSYGAWQQDERLGQGSAYSQARAWLWLLHEGARLCPEHPAVIAWGRCHGRDVLTGRDVADLAAEREAEARASLMGAL